MTISKVLVLIGLIVSAECATFSYSSFDASNQGNFRFNLNAGRYNNPPDGTLTLTLSQGSDAGSVFTQGTIRIDGFSTSFGFIIDQGFGFDDGTGFGADGFVFVLSGSSNAGGQIGGGIGYQGVSNSLGIEFDTYYNFDFGDINGNHIGIDLNGDIRSVQQAPANDIFNSGAQYYAWVDYNSDTTTLEVRYSLSTTRPTNPFISRIIDLAAVFGNADVYAGFSAATGGAGNRHRITSWTFENTFNPIVVIPTAVCGNGIVETGEQCDSSDSCCNSCSFAAASTVCRASAGPCDAAETCSGSSTSCPADSFAASSTVCRASAGDCDNAETCTGSSASCPVDSFVASTTVCRASAGACDVAETCTGSSASCPSDAIASSATVCRPAANACDVVEKCSGASVTCPVDVLSNSTSCFCARQNLAEGQMGYYCTVNGGYYQCLGGVFASQSRAMKCGTGTQCACATGAECSCGQSRSPCLRPNDPNVC